MPGNPYKAKKLILSKHLCLKVVPYSSQEPDVWISTPMRHPVTGEEMINQWMERKINNEHLCDMKDLIDKACAEYQRYMNEKE